MKKIFLILFLAINVFAVCAQSKSFTLRGTVVDQSNEPLAGVTVLVKKTSIATMTDADGKFQITITDTIKYKIIVFPVVGFQTQEYRINKNENDIRIVMKEFIELDVLEPISEPKKIEKLMITGSVAKVSSVDYAYPTESSSSADYYVSSTHNNIKSGTLTAGEVNDFAKWYLWGGILANDFKSYANIWGFKPINRYIAQLTNSKGMPVVNAQVILKNSNGTVWQAKTDNTGKAELWLNFFNSKIETDTANVKIIFNYEEKTAEIKNAITFEKGINTAQIDTKCNERNKVDMFFMMVLLI